MSIDWYEMFAFSLSPLELFVRGTAIYWFLLFAFRTFMQRDLGKLTRPPASTDLPPHSSPRPAPGMAFTRGAAPFSAIEALP